MKSFHCRHCGDKHDKLKPSFKRWNLENLLNKVRELILASEKSFITAEQISTILRAKKHLVEQCFHRLNLEGILSQGVNHAPHDSKRDPWRGSDSSWCATTYWLMKKEDQSI